MASDDSFSGYGFDSTHADGTKGHQEFLLCRASDVSTLLPVFTSATHVSIVEFMGETFGQRLEPGTVELGLSVNEQTLRVDRAFLDRFRVPGKPTPTNVILRFMEGPVGGTTLGNEMDVNTQRVREALGALPSYVYVLSTTAQQAFLGGETLSKDQWLTKNGTRLKHVP